MVNCLYELLSSQANKRPNTIAILSADGRSLTYRQLSSSVEQCAAALADSGVKNGDRVGVVLPNGMEMALAFLGIASIATCAPLNPTYQEKEFDFYLGDLEPQALVIADDKSPAASAARARGIPLLNIADLLTVDSARGNKPAFAQSSDIALVLHTSGTTSRPKIVPLSQENLYISAHNIGESLSLTTDDRCLSFMPLFHIHGLVGALLSSLAAGASIVCAPGFMASSIFAWIDEFSPSWYTAVPTMHQSILERAAANRDIIERRPLRFIRSCSAALPPKVMADLESAFHAPVVEAYGMTEASHQMACNPLPPLERKAGTVGLPTGIKVAIMDEAGQLLPTGEQGEIVIKGKTVTAGYANNPQANESAFAYGWFHTGDQGIIDADGYLSITGRIKELINRGGEKIAPREVDEVLIMHPAVAQAVTFALTHTQLGEDVAAAVVLREGMTVSERELREFVAGQLAAFKVPALIVFLAEIPKGPTGKLQRIGLADKLGIKAPSLQREQPAEYTPPRTPVEKTLCDLWAKVLGLQQVGIDQQFLLLGGDSMLATLLLSRIRDTFEVDLQFFQFFEAATVSEQALLITQSQVSNLSDDDRVEELLGALEGLNEEEVDRLLAEE